MKQRDIMTIAKSMGYNDPEHFFNSTGRKYPLYRMPKAEYENLGKKGFNTAPLIKNIGKIDTNTCIEGDIHSVDINSMYTMFYNTDKMPNKPVPEANKHDTMASCPCLHKVCFYKHKPKYKQYPEIELKSRTSWMGDFELDQHQKYYDCKIDIKDSIHFYPMDTRKFYSAKAPRMEYLKRKHPGYKKIWNAMTGYQMYNPGREDRRKQVKGRKKANNPYIYLYIVAMGRVHLYEQMVKIIDAGGSIISYHTDGIIYSGPHVFEYSNEVGKFKNDANGNNIVLRDSGTYIICQNNTITKERHQQSKDKKINFKLARCKKKRTGIHNISKLESFVVRKFG